MSGLILLFGPKGDCYPSFLSKHKLYVRSSGSCWLPATAGSQYSFGIVVPLLFYIVQRCCHWERPVEWMNSKYIVLFKHLYCIQCSLLAKERYLFGQRRLASLRFTQPKRLTTFRKRNMIFKGYCLRMRRGIKICACHLLEEFFHGDFHT